MPCCFISNLETELHRCSVQLDVPRKTLLSVIICKAMGGVRLTVVTFPCCVQHQHFGNSDTFNACWVIRWLQNPSNSDMDYGKRVGSTYRARALTLKSQVRSAQSSMVTTWMGARLCTCPEISSESNSVQTKKKSFKWDYELRSAMCIYICM